MHESLTENTQFVRRLAASLLSDPHAAADVAQQTMVAAWHQPPSRAGNARAWLAAVTRNLAARRVRSETRRARHEQGARQRCTQESTIENVVRLETQRRVVDAALALPTVYREVIVRRYLDEQSPARIASDLDIPLGTVKTRLKRALHTLRARLDGDTPGGRKAWSLALLALVPRGALAGATLVMGIKTKVALVCVVLFALGGSALLVGRALETSGASASRTEQSARSVPSNEPPTAVAVAALPAATHAAQRQYRVATGVPGARVTVRFRYIGGEPDPAPSLLVADDEGVVAFDAPRDRKLLHDIVVDAHAPGHGRVRTMLKDASMALTLPKGDVVSGIVLGPSGRPVADALVLCGSGFRTGSDGTFRVAAPGLGNGRPLTVTHSAYRPFEQTIKQAREDHIIRLDEGETVGGRIQFPDGNPVANIWVSIAAAKTWSRTDRQGRYRLTGLKAGEYTLRLHLSPRARPGRVDGYIQTLKGRGGQADADATIRTSAVRVRVVDEADRPFRLAQVTLTAQGEGWAGVETDAQGEAWFVCGRPKATIAAQAPGHMSDSFQLDNSGDGRIRSVELRLLPVRASGSLRIHALRPDGQPLARIYVSLTVQGGQRIPTCSERPCPLDADGYAQLPELPPGKYTAHIATEPYPHLQRYELDRYVPVTIEERQQQQVEAKFELGGRVRVTVRNRQGAIVAPHSLKCRQALTGFVPEDLKTRWTSYPLNQAVPHRTWTAIRPGRYDVVLRRNGKNPVTKSVDVRAGETAELEFTVD